MDKARHAAYETLLRIERDGAYSNLALSAALDSGGFSAADSAFAAALVYTTVERQITIDDQLSRYLRQPLKKLRPEVRIVLRMGASQILFMDKVPASAAVNESVRLVRQNKNIAWAAGLVNAVLRKTAQNGLCLPQGEDDDARSVRYSCPKWLVRLWTDAYGKDEADAIMARALGGTQTVVRVNTLKTDAGTLAQTLAAEGVQTRPFDGLPDALILEKCGAPERLCAFADGLFHVQDAASQYCCRALDVQPGQTVYDVCAAPGGKSFTLAQIMKNTGSLCAFDLYEQRVRLIAEGASRLGVGNLRAAVWDAAVRDDSRPRADRVLCDVPCSGLGVIAKKPEIRYKTPQEIDKLRDLQYNILCISASYLKKGGILVYSTCSLNPQENEEICRKFLAEHPSFRTLEILPDVDKRVQDNMVTLLPHRSRSDGFFITAMTETE
ncbi:MAG: 16S rRNA (cytosine(967)-C(5))-methyltransferase RsmB [Clostridia bacterium]|nr:16S rRNA (cytosine(967)-C(5))-methyltransferase RsmB [Clostridia bacterium]